MARGSATGAGFQPFASSLASTNASIGVRTHAASLTVGTLGEGIGRNAQCSRSFGLILASYCWGDGNCPAAMAGRTIAVRIEQARMLGIILRVLAGCKYTDDGDRNLNREVGS